MVVRAGYIAVALSLQEAADALSSNEMRSRLSDAVSDAHKGSGKYASYVDHTGDEDSGDCIYQCSGMDGSGDYSTDTFKAPYSKGTDSSDEDYSLDTGKRVPVAMRTNWEELPDEGDHYSKMQESNRQQKLYSSIPLYERFVSKKERDAAGAGDFAGKGKSFPILKAADVSAAASSIGRAGSGNYSTDVIKRNIIRIAKAKGWTSELPKAWQDGGDSDSKKESARAVAPAVGTLTLVESSAFATDLTIREALSPGKQIKLIAPGKGSSAFYTEAALKQAAADRIFREGTPMRIDHPTDAEESARPEGSVKDWGAVLASDAVYQESHPQGPGLYATIKPFSDHAQIINEKGPYAGVSIRANGNALMESGKPVMREGVPVIEKFTSAEGVDMVTRAGAGGKFLLSESARSARGEDMESAELKALRESTARLVKRALEGDARQEARRILAPLTLAESAKALVIDHVIEAGIPANGDAVDVAKLKEALEAEARRVGEAFSAAAGGGRVVGMGVRTEPVEIDAKEAERREANNKRLRESTIQSFMDMGLPRAAAEKAADKGQEVAA